MLRTKGNLRELKDIQEPLFIFKHLKADLDVLKSQLNNIKNAKLSSKLLRGINLKKSDELDIKHFEYTGANAIAGGTQFIATAHVHPGLAATTGSAVLFAKYFTASYSSQ